MSLRTATLVKEEDNDNIPVVTAVMVGSDTENKERMQKALKFIEKLSDEIEGLKECLLKIDQEIKIANDSIRRRRNIDDELKLVRQQITSEMSKMNALKRVISAAESHLRLKKMVIESRKDVCSEMFGDEEDIKLGEFEDDSIKETRADIEEEFKRMDLKKKLIEELNEREKECIKIQKSHFNPKVYNDLRKMEEKRSSLTTEIQCVKKRRSYAELIMKKLENESYAMERGIKFNAKCYDPSYIESLIKRCDAHRNEISNATLIKKMKRPLERHIAHNVIFCTLDYDRNDHAYIKEMQGAKERYETNTQRSGRHIAERLEGQLWSYHRTKKEKAKYRGGRNRYL